MTSWLIKKVYVFYYYKVGWLNIKKYYKVNYAIPHILYDEPTKSCALWYF